MKAHGALLVRELVSAVQLYGGTSAGTMSKHLFDI
jgi:hypothetical protein